MDDQKDNSAEEEILKGVAGIVYAGVYYPLIPFHQYHSYTNHTLGGADTVCVSSFCVLLVIRCLAQTISVINTIILGLLLYPETQKTAYAEIDQVIGISRLPEFEDLKSLPYIRE